MRELRAALGRRLIHDGLEILAASTDTPGEAVGEVARQAFGVLREVEPDAARTFIAGAAADLAAAAGVPWQSLARKKAR